MSLTQTLQPMLPLMSKACPNLTQVRNKCLNSALYHSGPNTLGSSISLEQLAEVKSQVNTFRERFQRIKFATIECLIACQIAVATMPLWLTEIDELCEHKIFLKENLDDFAKCETHYLLFGKLNFYWNYLAYDLLYQLIEVLHQIHKEFKPTHEDMVAYKKYLEEFRKHTSLKVFCEVQQDPLTEKDEPPSGFKSMVVQFKWAKDVTLEEVERFRRSYARSYKLNECAMMVNRIRPGSFTVTWFIPVSTIVTLTQKKDVDLFIKFNVTTLVIDGTCTYVSPVEEAPSLPLTNTHIMVSYLHFGV